MPTWTIRVCSACGILVEDDRDYGGPLPIDADGCLESPRCGTILPRHEMPEGRDAFGAKACPGEKAVEVVASATYQGAVDALTTVYEAGLRLAVLTGTIDEPDYFAWEIAMDAARGIVRGQA